jgi:hypothetical protein
VRVGLETSFREHKGCKREDGQGGRLAAIHNKYLVDSHVLKPKTPIEKIPGFLLDQPGQNPHSRHPHFMKTLQDDINFIAALVAIRLHQLRPISVDFQ